MLYAFHSLCEVSRRLVIFLFARGWGDSMKKFLCLGGLLLAASLTAGCLQTLPDGSIAAAPGTAALLMGAQDPDPSIRQSFMRDKCQVVVESGCASGN